MVAAVGTVSSCKDYNDEIIADYRGEDDELKKSLEEQIAQLKEQHEADLQAAEERLQTLQNELDAHIAAAQQEYATKTELEAAKAELVAADAALRAELDAAKNELKAADDALKTELQTKINGLQTQIDGVQTKISNIDNQLGALDTKIDNVKAELQNKIDALAECKCDLQDLKDGVAKIEGLENRISNLEAKEHLTKDDVKKLIEDFCEVCTCDPNLSIRVDGIDQNLITTTGNLKTLKEQVERDSLYLVTVVNNYDTIIKVIKETEVLRHDSLVADIEGLKNDFEADIEVIEGNMENLYNLIVTNLELANNYTDDAVSQLKDYVVPEIDGIKGLLNQVRIDVEALKPLQETVAALQTQVAANTAAISNLTTKVNNIETSLEQRISSVNIQGAYSPVIGYFNMPMGIKSNIVAAYYGEFGTGETEINFPFAYSSSMLNGEMNDLNDLKASLGYEGETIDELNDGKAGKIYLTVNPTEVNLEEVEFALVNSLGEDAPVELTVQPSEDVLKFGYTRAGATLYEAAAKITDNEATDLSLNVSDYKEVFRDLKDGGSINLSLIAEALYGTFNEIADANAVSAKWTDAMGHSHTVLSNYDIAALSVKPLSFNFMKDQKISSIDAIDKVCNLIDKINKRVKIDLGLTDFDEIEVELDYLEMNENDFIVNIPIGGYQIHKDAETGKFYIMYQGKKTWVNVNGDYEDGDYLYFSYNYEDMVDDILELEDHEKDQIDQVKKVVDQINDILAQLKDTEDKVYDKVNNTSDKIASKLISYLDKLNNYASGVLSSVNAKLQPVLLLSTADDFALLSQAETRPVEVSGELTLVPTTYSGELLAPAYKKYVAITAVDGSTDNLAAVNAAAGENLNKVLDGDVREITFKGEAGKTYEITYSALDYAGFVVNNKYYVTVK